MKTFTFKGVTSDSLKLIVKSMPLVPLAQRDIESIEVSGRNGNLHIDNKTYRAREYTIECIMTDLSKLDEIKKTLCGNGNLIISTEPNRTYTAMVMNQIDFKEYATLLSEFPLQFELSPFSYTTNVTTVTRTTSGTFTVGGNVETKPSLTITGTGTLTLNGKSLTVNETGITIDCDLMNCTIGNVNKNNMVVLDEFPGLVLGSNSITLGEGITKVVISYQESWL